MPGVFGLREARIEQIKNISTSSFRYWSESAKYGYFSSGSTPGFPGYVSAITRLDFSNEIVSNPGKNLPIEKRLSVGVSNNSYGYFAGGAANGSPEPIVSTITRLDFSNETVSDPTKNLPTVRVYVAGVSNNSYGYFGGGSDPIASISTITRLDFSNETVSNPGKNFAGAVGGRSGAAGVSNNSYGYFGGGNISTTTFYSTITRLDFSNETVSDPGKNLPSQKTQEAGVSNNYYGYFVGGAVGPPLYTYFSTITRLDFSTETVSDPGNNLPTARYSAAGSVSSNSCAYFVGGWTPTSITVRLDFSNETVSFPGKNLPAPRWDGASVSGGGASVLRPNKTYGYFAGGGTPAITTITKLNFSDETVSNPGNNLPVGRWGAAGVSNNSYGYFGGGATPATISTITRLDFSNETVFNPGNNLPTPRSSVAGVTNSN